ncbi:MAG: PAS domain-containing protein [Anaerolineae bacterium]|nr:PAS domain-containing protein [Anaerolineae bacterium]
MNYETIFASLPDAACIVDNKGQVVAVNPAAEWLLGWWLAGLPACPLADSLPQLIPDPAQALYWSIALGQALDQGQTTEIIPPTNITAVGDPGTFIPITGTIGPWRDPAGQILGALLLLRPAPPGATRDDIRERFAAMVAHEISSPLANISAATDRLSDDRELDDPQRLRLLQILRTETHRLRRLLGQFLTPPAPPEPTAPPDTIVTLRPLLRRVVHIFELQDRHHQVAVHIPPDIPFVWGDAGRIQEVLSNLVDHTLRLAPPGSQVTITVVELNHTVAVTVSAAAAGQPPGSKPPALALQLAQLTTHALGGELSHSYDPTTGTRFCFTLQSVAGARDGEE